MGLALPHALPPLPVGCGSYSHVVPKCLEESPTAKWWAAYYKAGGKQSELVVHIEKGADYDGLAVAWGLGNKKGSAEECALQCLQHMPGKVEGERSSGLEVEETCTGLPGI